MMIPDTWLVAGVLISGFLLSILWAFQIGITRGVLAGFCRVLWLSPVLLAFFPQINSEPIPSSVSLKPIHVLLDDSDSMSDAGADESSLKKAEDLKTQMTKKCLRLGCQIKTTYLSDLEEKTRRGYTPLDPAMKAWQYKVGGDPWVLMSDGGDWQPKSPWSSSLRGFGKAESKNQDQRGLVVGLTGAEKNNLWIESMDVPPFAFQSQEFEVLARLRRTSIQSSREERVQVQLLQGERLLATTNILFEKDEESAEVALKSPALARGRHLLRVRVVPSASETSVWDNDESENVEVMPNTLGVLHLLGAPSWDGRFVRRYLKAEPKYDLISFFILRDRWDSQLVSERDLSLIPFPVERLFNEELPNFKVVIIQNFALFEFLQPEFQENLVKFVKQGGGLLFLGGPRALQKGDLEDSPLAEILPFHSSPEAKDPQTRQGSFLDSLGANSREKSGPYYDGGQKFRIQLASPKEEERSLANVYNDWQDLDREFQNFSGARGIHRTDRVQFRKGVHTELLTAVTPDQQKLPLAVASYPGKGRAIWLFSDTLWRMAIQDDSNISRYAHHKFLSSSLRWLMRQEYRQPLVASGFRLSQHSSESLHWQANLRGAAAKYFVADSSWQVNVCGVVVDSSGIQIDRTTQSSATVSGSLGGTFPQGEPCELSISGEHEAFGAVSARSTGLLPRTFTDKEVGAAMGRLSSLSQHTGARLLDQNAAAASVVEAWLESRMGIDQSLKPLRYKSTEDHYWAFKAWWTWLLLLLLPGEVIIRRWHLLFGTVRQATD